MPHSTPSNSNQHAIVIGATGLVGRALVEELCQSDVYAHISIFVRRPSGIQHAKLTEYVIDFDQPEEWVYQLKNTKGDVLFSALGTTLAQAGSKEAQYKVDYHYQYTFAELAAECGVKNYVLVSAINANSTSRLFYPKMKGQLEDAVLKLAFEKIVLIRPGLLHGEREHYRLGEELAFKVLSTLNKVGVLSNQRPIHGSEVAKAMLQSLRIETTGKVNRYTGAELFELNKAG